MPVGFTWPLVPARVTGIKRRKVGYGRTLTSSEPEKDVPSFNSPSSVKTAEGGLDVLASGRWEDISSTAVDADYGAWSVQVGFRVVREFAPAR